MALLRFLDTFPRLSQVLSKTKLNLCDCQASLFSSFFGARNQVGYVYKYSYDSDLESEENCNRARFHTYRTDVVIWKQPWKNCLTHCRRNRKRDVSHQAKKVEKHHHDSSFSVAARVFRFISTWLFFRNKMLPWLFCFHLHIKWAWVKLHLLLWYQILLKQTFDYIVSRLSFNFMMVL